MCKGRQTYSCDGVVKSGGKCIGEGYGSCNVIVEEGGVCIDETGMGCYLSTIKSGGKCIAKRPGGCLTSYTSSGYEGTGCCEEGIPGEINCSSYVPKC